MYSVTFKFQDGRGLTALLEKIVAHGSGPAITTLAEIANRMETMSGTMQGELDELRANVEKLTTVRAGVEALVSGIPAMIQAAVDDAVAKGATPEQLAAFDEMNATLQAQIDGVASAVTSNTPAEGEDEGGAGEPVDGVDTVAGADTVPPADTGPRIV